MKDIEKLIDFMKSVLADDHTGHNHQHSLRVLNNALKIHEGERQGDKDIICASAIVHDCMDKKLFRDTDGQIVKIRIALKSNGFNENEIEQVLYIINNISWNNGKNVPLDNVNAMIVRDADRLDAIGAMGIIRAIEYGTSHLRPFYEDVNLKIEDEKYTHGQDSDSTLTHFYEKLLFLKNAMHTKTGRKMAKERHKFIEQFLSRFYNEL
ncbi:MAG: HD domain-containing protein [Clostridiales bacterium]|jgi:uncharacterized protein|nr:HD domain-containing protein [Clostridiales bacterium]